MAIQKKERTKKLKSYPEMRMKQYGTMSYKKRRKK